jgi:hypothetical protein
VLGLVLITPVALGVAGLVLWVGRGADAEAQVQAASAAAAQAAARQRTPAAGLAAASDVARTMLVDAAACAGGPRVRIDAASWRPGGSISVSIDCTPDNSDLGALAPSPRTVRGVATASLDPFRAGALP